MIIEVIQGAADRLRADPWFSNVGVVSEDLGDPATAIDTFIETLGTGCIIMTPKGGVKHPDLPGPYFENIAFIVGVFESVMLNRGNGGTGKAALSTVEVVLALLHQWAPVGVTETLIATDPAWVLVPNRDQLVYNVFFKTEGGITYPVQTVAPVVPTVVDNGNGTKTVSLACATPYAYIFFTLDGSYPAPLDGSGTARAPYTVPFTATTGTRIIARAWMPGYNASQVLALNA